MSAHARLAPAATLPSPVRPRTAHAPATRAGWTSRQLAVAIASVLAVWAIAAAAWPLTGTVVPWDSKNHFYPMFRYLAGALADGEFPLWNPFHFSGHPSAADPQSLLFTPTMLLFGLVAPHASMEVFDVVIFAHFLPGAIALLFLFRRAGWRPEGGVLAAIVFILGGSASARLQHTGIIFGYGLFPLALLLLEEALARRSWRWGAGFAVIAALMVVGRDQVAFLSGLTLVGLVVHRTLESGRPLAYLRDRVWLLAGMAVVGGALLAVPVILTMQLLSTSTRPSFGFGVAAMGSLPPESLATIMFANVFGSLRTTYDYWGPDWHSLLEGTWTDRATNYLFVGTVPALLILWHGIGGGRLFHREFRFYLVAVTVALVYGLGRYTPAFSFIFDSLPGVDLYRRPADATFLINIVLAVAAGYLLHRFVEDGAPRLTFLHGPVLAALRSAAAVGLPLAAIAAAFVFAFRAGHLPDAAISVAGGLAAAGCAIWAMTRASVRWAPAALAGVLVAATAGELVWRDAASPLNAEPASRYGAFSTLPPDQAAGLAVLRSELAERHARGEHPRVEILGLSGGWQNAGMTLGLEDTIGYNPLRLAEYEEAIGPGENAVDPNLRQFPATFRGYRCRLARLLGLEYLVLDRSLENLPKHFPRLTGAELLFGRGSMWIYRLPGAAPRAYLATRLQPVDGETVLASGELPDFDKRSGALVESDQTDQLQADFGMHDDSPEPDAAVGSVSIRDYRRNAVSLEVDSDRDALVVLHDIFYPGWEARVDGKPAPIIRTNLLFRGVEVPAGHHRIEMAFRPLSPRNLWAAASGLVHGSTEGVAVADGR